MALFNPFKAGQATQPSEIRRAINSAFTNLVSQINTSLNRPTIPVVSSLPTNPRRGEIIYLTTASTNPAVSVGVRVYDGDQWR